MTSRHELGVQRATWHLDRQELLRQTALRIGDTAAATTAKLVRSYVFCPQLDQIFWLFSDSLDQGMSMVAFRHMLENFCEYERGPLGGRHKIHPADKWLASKQRKTVAGLQMRPDISTSLFEENGKQWLNVYSPPAHHGNGGTPLTFWRFLEYLIPSESERTYFINWLSYKFQHPEVPGPAIIMVARRHGTGRGTLGEIIRVLFGPSYVRTVPFHIFSGSSYQSQYNDWGANSLLVLVNESSEGGAHPYASKRDTYEHLKDIVEPRSIIRTYITKNRNSFQAPSFTSYLLASNHADALPIPAGDRRFAIIQNGDPAPTEFYRTLNEWLAEPANVNSLANYLASHLTTGYSPFEAPPMTIAKQSMVDLATSDLDRAFDRALEALPGSAFVPNQFLAAMEAAKVEYDLALPERWQQTAKRLIQSRLHRVGNRHAHNWFSQVGRVKHPNYARDGSAARRWTNAPSEDLRVEILKNGPITGTKAPVQALAEHILRQPLPGTVGDRAMSQSHREGTVDAPRLRRRRELK